MTDLSFAVYVHRIRSLCKRNVKFASGVPASVAQLDACLTGDQEVAGLIPARSATFFREG